MTDLTHHTPPVSGVPEESRASRRIKPREGGLSESLAPHLQRFPSLVVSWLVAQPCILLLGVFMVSLGFFVTKVLLASGTISNADDWFPEWLAAHRSPFWTDASYVGSLIADVPVLVPFVGLVCLSLVLYRRWRTASFVLQAALAEFTSYAIAVYFISRLRPEVVRLDTFNVHHSYPSGHVAASTAIYGAAALLLAAHFKALPLRIAIWTVAAIIPLTVGLARMYRGEHHPIDVAAGMLMGVGAILVGIFAVRTARAVAELRAKKQIELFS